MKNKKLLISLVILATLAIVFVILEKTHVTNFIKTQPKDTSSTQGPTVEQQKQEAEMNAANKQQAVENQSSGSNSGSTSTAIELSTETEANNTVTVFTKLTGYSDGNCVLRVTNGSKSSTQTAVVVYQPEYSSCAGFSVPIDSVGRGTWSLTLTVTSNSSSASKTISTEIK